MPRSAREPAQPALDCDVDRVVIEGLCALPELSRARTAAELLARCRGERAAFALCLLTLELARQQDEQASSQLPAHVGILLEAFRSPALARVLVAENRELAARWEKIRPIIAEFVSSRNVRVDAREVTPADDNLPARLEDEATARVETPPNSRSAKPVEVIEQPSPILEHERTTGSASLPGTSPSVAETSAPAEQPSAQLEESPASAVPTGLPAPSVSPPPAPPRTGEFHLPAGVDPCPLDPATREFWNFTEVALGRVPDDSQNLLHPQCFIAEKSAERTSLTRFARELVGRFPKVPQARALASLTLLYVAGQEKVRGLFGVNRERLETIRVALSLLGDPEAGADAAVLFESDGGTTRRSFVQVVEILHGFLAFCLKHQLDPQLPEAALRFTKR